MRKVTLFVLLALLIGAFVVPAGAQDNMDALVQAVMAGRTACSADLTGRDADFNFTTLYHIGDLSGGYRLITAPLLAGFDDALAFFNEHGGLCGLKMSHSPNDTGGNQKETENHYNRISTMASKPSLMVLYASDDAELLAERLAQDEIPVLISAGSIKGLYGDDAMSPGWIFATNPLYVDQLGAFCDFVSANPDRFPENPTIGYIAWDSAFGRAALTPEAIAYCGEKGVTVLEEGQFYQTGGTEVTQQVLKLIDGGANILYNMSLATGPAAVANVVVQEGYEDEVVLAGVNWVLDTSVGGVSGQFAAQGLARSSGLPAVDGMYGSMPFYWWSEVNQPGIQLITSIFVPKLQAGERQPGDRNIAYLLGWMTIDLYIEIMVQTGNRVGFENIDGAAVKETIETMNYSPMGLLNVNFQNGEIRDLPGNRIAMMKFLNAAGNGPATSGEDLAKDAEGKPRFVPLVVPLTDFTNVPDLRPGMMGEG